MVVERGVVIRVPVQQQQRGLGGDGQADLVGDGQAAAALERFFVQQHLHDAVQLGAIRGAHRANERNVAVDQRGVGVGQRGGPQAGAAAVAEGVPHGLRVEGGGGGGGGSAPGPRFAKPKRGPAFSSAAGCARRRLRATHTSAEPDVWVPFRRPRVAPAERGDGSNTAGFRRVGRVGFRIKH